MDRRKAPTVSHLIRDRIELLRHRLLPAAYQEPTTKDDVWWGTVNLPLSENSFKINRYLAFKLDVSNSNHHRIMMNLRQEAKPVVLDPVG